MTASHLNVLPIFIVFVSALSLQSARCQDAVRVEQPLRLNQAIDTTLGNNAQIKNSELDIEIAKDRVKAARTRFLPNMHVSAFGLQLLTPLNLDFGKGVFGDFKSTGPIPSQNTSVGTDQRPVFFVNAAVYQPLFQLGKVELGVRQGVLARVIAEQKLKIQRQQLVSQVKHAYYKALELEGTLKVIESSKKTYQEIDRLTNDYLAQKMVLPADSLAAKQQLASAQYEEIKVRNALDSQKEEINHLLGRDCRTSISLTTLGEPAALTMDLQSAQSRALSNRAEIQQAGYQTKQIELEKRIKMLEYLPDLSLIVDYLSVFNAEFFPKNIFMAGLALNWEPIDWGRRHWEISEQRKLLKQSNNTAKELETQIILEVNSSYRKLTEASEFLQVAQLGRDLAAERLRVIANKYKEKAVLLKDALQAEKELSEANSKYREAVLAIWTGRADFEKAIGEE